MDSKICQVTNNCEASTKKTFFTVFKERQKEAAF